MTPLDHPKAEAAAKDAKATASDAPIGVRDTFAVAALQGLLAVGARPATDTLVAEAYAIADAMLQVRKGLEA